MKKIVFGLLVLPYFALALWYNYNSAFNMAKAQNKPLMIYFYQEHCEDCKHMEMFTLSEKAVSDFMDRHFVVASVNLDSSNGKNIGRIYNVFGTPTSVFVNPKTGKILYKTFGDVNANIFLKALNNVCDKSLKGGIRC